MPPDVTRRRLLAQLLTVGALLPLAAPLVAAGCKSGASYPERPITAVVPFAAGGPTDVIMRLLGEHMSKTLGQALVIENAPGAGGTTSSARAAGAKPDGYTILIGNMGTHAAAPALYPNLKYDPSGDFEPIGMAAGTAIVIEARKDFPAQNLSEFVSQLKDNGSKLNEAHAGVGSITFVACTMLYQLLGVAPTRVAYRGTSPAMNDLVGGQVDFMCDQILNGISQVRTGAIRAYAIASPERSPALPDVPTTREAGLPEFQVSAWNALFAPKGTPPAIVQRLNQALSLALDDAGVRQRLLDLGCIIPAPAERTPDALARYVQQEVQRWTPLLKAAGAVAEAEARP
jgi:tripartite-type tricarboxylate transporter receptor subunit TctC